MTDRFSNHVDVLEHLLQPETALEQSLLGIPAVQQGLFWGEPRFGHPEGKVVLHVRELLDNIALIPGISAKERAQLRIIAIIHDVFKHQESRTRPRDWTKHHGILARHFMEDYTDDRAVLDIIETHDDAYYKWLNERRRPSLHQPLAALLERVGYCIQLYYLFFKCDTQTGDKTQAPLRWFEQHAPGIDIVKIKPYWPWER